MIVQNLKEGKDQEVDEYLNNVEVLEGDMIVIVIEVRLPLSKEIKLTDRI